MGFKIVGNGEKAKTICGLINITDEEEEDNDGTAECKGYGGY